MNFKKDTGDFQSVDRALELTGHSAGIPAFAFSGDSTHVVSVSKDKTFRLYDIIVEYKKKQDARLIHSAPWTKEDVDVASTQVALSNDSRCVVIATKGDILILSGVDGSLKTLIQSPIPGTIPSEKFKFKNKKVTIFINFEIFSQKIEQFLSTSKFFFLKLNNFDQI